MKTKVEKALKYLAISVFLIALAINAKVTLDDPFTFMNDDAIALTTGTGVKTKCCRKVGCSGIWTGTASAEGCINVYSKRICGFRANIEVTYTYFGSNENCTAGESWYDCDACQKDCVLPTTTATSGS